MRNCVKRGSDLDLEVCIAVVEDVKGFSNLVVHSHSVYSWFYYIWK